MVLKTISPGYGVQAALMLFSYVKTRISGSLTVDKYSLVRIYTSVGQGDRC